MPTRARLEIAVVVVPALVIAGLGLTHPPHLTQDMAHHWRDMHVALLPLFPLLGLAPWLVARRVDRQLAWVVALAAYVFATFYTALDVLAGIGAGGLKVNHRNGLGTLFHLASELGRIGSDALVVASLVAGYLAVRVAGWRAVPGVVAVLVADVLFREHHVYRPWGVLAMVLLALGWGWLAAVVPLRRPATSRA